MSSVAGLARLALGFAALAAIHFARNPGLFLEPVLPLDDALLFQHYYNTLGTGEVFYYATSMRYVAVLPQLTGFLAVGLLDVRQVPMAFSLSSLFLLSGACLLFATPLFAPLFPRPALRAGLALLMALLPAGAFALVGEAVFQSWTALLAGVALCVAPTPRRAWARAGAMALAVLCLWSSPLSPVVLPVLGFRAWRAWRGRDAPGFEYAGLLGLAVLLYAAVGIHPESWARLAGGGGGDLPAGGIRWLRLALASLAFTLDRVIGEALLGYRCRIFLIGRGLGWVPPLVGLGAAALAAREGVRQLRGRPDAVRFALALVYLILALSFLAFAARPHVPDVLRLEGAFRYAYVQKYLWWLLMVFLAQPRLEALRAAGARRAAAAWCAGALLWAALLAASNLAPYQTGWVSERVEEQIAAGALRRPEVLDARQLQAFLAEVSRAERTLAPGEGRELVQSRSGYELRLRVRRR